MAAMDTPETQAETPLLATLREDKEQAAAEARAAARALQTAQAVVAQAEAGLQTRRDQAAAFEAQAQEAATAALAQGTAEAREEERAADEAAQTVLRELRRAEVAVASFQAAADQAAAHYRALAERAVAAEAAYQRAEFVEQGQRHHARLDAALAELVAAAAASRAHNHEARNHCPQAVVLPGEEAARSAANAGGVFADQLAEQGVYVTFAPDLCRADIDETQGKHIAARRGPDLAALYAGWGR